MQKGLERRSPERQPHTLRLLRRLSALALASALILAVAPRLLAYLGLIGPTAADRIGEAERAITAAESYGAAPRAPALLAARQQLTAARRLAAEGRDREAREAAMSAAAKATEAQAAALVEEARARQRAQAVVQELDDEVNALENLYETVTPGLDRQGRAAALKRMREARKAAAIVFLAHDEKRFEDALAREDEARRALAAARAALEGMAPAGTVIPPAGSAIRPLRPSPGGAPPSPVTGAATSNRRPGPA